MGMGFNLVDAFQRVLAMHPEKTAIYCGGNSFTFLEMEDRIVRIASSLVKKGVVFGDRIAVLSSNCHRYVELYWAGAILGVAIVPLESRLTEDDMRFILSEVQPKVLVGDTRERAHLLASLYPSSSFVVLMDGDSDGVRLVQYEELAVGEPRDLAASEIDSDTPIAIFYTAAVEGRPKGAIVSHKNLVCQSVQTGNRVGMNEEDSHGVFLPLSHTFGAYLMFVATCNGAANTLLSIFDAYGAVELIQKGRVTFFAEFAPMGERIWQAAQQSGVVLAPKLRFVFGLDLPPTIGKYLDAGVRFWCLYGQTETAGLVTMGESLPGRVVANYSGTPLELTNISLRGEDGKVVDDGQAGEAWIRSDCVVTHYWPNEPTRLTPDGWLRTGDILRSEPGQEFFFVGRKSDKDLIKPGGLNVYPAEVEQVLCQHEMVKSAYVFGVPDPVWRERVCAVVVPRQERTVNLEIELRNVCERNLPSYKQPVELVIAEELVSETEGLSRAEVKARYSDLVTNDLVVDHHGSEKTEGRG